MTRTSAPVEDAVARRILVLYCWAAPLLIFYVGLEESVSIWGTDLLLPVTAVAALRTRRLKLTLFTAALWFYGVCVATSLLAFPDPHSVMAAALRWIRLCGMFAPLILIAGNRLAPETFDRCLRAFLFSGLIALVIGCVLFFGDLELVHMRQTYVVDASIRARAGGLAGDTSAFGHLLATWAALCGCFVLPRTSGMRKIGLAVLVAAVAGLCLYASMSRAAFLDLFAVFVISMVFRESHTQRRWWRKPLTLAIIAFTLAVGLHLPEVYEAAVQSPHARFLSLFSEGLADAQALDRTSSGRITTWIRALEIWQNHIGIGVGYKSLALIYKVAPDNNFLLALVETGIGGFIALCTVFISALFAAFRLRHTSAGRAFVLIWFGQLLHALTVDIFTFPSSMTVLLLLTALWITHGRPAPQGSVARPTLQVPHPGFARPLTIAGARMRF